MRVRPVAAVCTALVLAAALCAAVMMLVPGAPRQAVPRQQMGSAAGLPHRVSAADTMGRVVDGRLVLPRAGQGAAGGRGPGSGQARQAGPGLGAAGAGGAGSGPGVSFARPAAPKRMPVRGKAADTLTGGRVLAAPVKTGFAAGTSRRLAPSRADQVVYVNADGTRTAFEYTSPVNYRRPDGTWVPVSAALVPAGAAAAAGWTQRSEAEPVRFAPYASARDLVSLPVGGGDVVAFGVAGAGPVPGVVTGDSVTYPGAVAGADIGYTAGTGAVREQITLDSAAAPASWVFPLDLKGLHAVMGAGGTVDFADASGTVLAYVPHGLMTDSNVDPHSGDGAVSTGVSYSLTTVDGRQAIVMTLDAAWLDDPARVYPVRVDPSTFPVGHVGSGGSVYVQGNTSGTNDFSGTDTLKVGTYDGGTDTAKSFVSFGNVHSSLTNDYVLGAQLDVFDEWSYSCQARPVYVYPVTSAWSPSSVTGPPGPSTGKAVGRSSFAYGWAPLGSSNGSGSQCKPQWVRLNLDQAGTKLVNGWTHGSADNGLALGASNSDSYGWKKFAPYSTGAGNPVLSITYSPDAASYKLASRRPVTEVLPSQNGVISVTVTNTGATTWTSTNGYELSYRAYKPGKPKPVLVANHPVFTPVPAGTTVAPGQSVTLKATVDALPTGLYQLDWEMYKGVGSSPVSFTSEGVPYMGMYLNVPVVVTVSNVYPPTGFVSSTLRQQLSTTATATGTLTYSFTLTCKPVSGQSCVLANPVTVSGLTKAYWTPPRADMQWNTPYQWSVTVTGTSSTGSKTTVTVSGIGISAEVPQPGITAGLGGTSGLAYDPLSGNYTTSATDAAVATPVMPLKVTRTYNSMDPRISGAFGAGWSSMVDTALRPDNDGTGNVTVTLMDGKQVRFGQNGDNSYAPPFGSHDILLHNSSGTWTLRDTSGYQYTFTSGGVISSIADPGLHQSLQFTATSGHITTITDSASGRFLTLTWNPAGGAAKYAHVASVATQAPGTGQPPSTWTYAYTGDELTQACAPSGCTNYGYATSGSLYLPSVLDQGPRTYWQLGEASGSTTAADEVDQNLGTTDGTYSNAGLGVAGPLAGSTETAVSFNGTSSSVGLPDNLITDSTDESVGLWFKGASSTASGVLFSYQAQSLAAAAGNHTPALYVGGNGELYGEFWDGSVNPINTATSVDDGKWHYVVLTAESSTQSMYLDGAFIGSVSGTIDNLNMKIDSVGAGMWSSWPQATKGGTATTVGYFSGDIGQVAIYAHPLGAPAIAAQYAAGTGASPELGQITLPSGNTFESITYDPATDRVATYTDQNGGTWQIGTPVSSGEKAGSDGVGLVIDNVTVTTPAPASLQQDYAYDMLNGGRLISYNNGVDSDQMYGYDANGFLATVVDPDGNLVCMTSDAHGNVLTRTWYGTEPAVLPGGVIGTVNGCGGSTSSSPDCVSLAAPCTTFYGYTTYDSANPLDPDNNKLAYTGDGRSASTTDTTYRTSYTYDSAGQLLTMTTPDGQVTHYAYSPVGGSIPAGLLTSVTTPRGAVTGYSYDSAGNLTQVAGPSGKTTSYSYDALGRATAATVVTSAGSATTTYAYTATNKLATVTYPAVPNPLANVTHTRQDTYTYDQDDNLHTVTQADLTGGDQPRVTTYDYNDQDQLADVTRPDGATGSTGASPTDGAGSSDPQGATTSYEYDSLGNISQVTDADGNTYRYQYNEYSKPVQVALYTSSGDESATAPSCTAPQVPDLDGIGCDLVLDSYSYDQAGLLAAVTDAMGRITNYTYDPGQELLSVTSTDASTSPSTGRQTLYGYDGAGNLISQQANGLSAGGLKNSTLTTYTINPAGLVTSQVQDATPAGGSGDLNRTVSFTYNNDHELTTQTTGTAAQGGTAVTSYGYDLAGDLTSRTVQVGATSLETSWTYQDGQQMSMVTPAGNAAGGTPASDTTSYTYDIAGNLAIVQGPPVTVQAYGQLSASTRPVTSYGYDTFGDQTQIQDPNLNVTTKTYDPAGRLASLTAPPYTAPGTTSAITATTRYSYDENGNLATVTDPKGNTTSYGYDGLGDLTTVTQPQLQDQSAPGQWQFSYDPDREQLSATDPLGHTASATYSYFGQQASSTDALGNTTQYGHDYLGDLTTTTTPDGVVTTSTYDHLGELTSTADAYGNTYSYQYNDLGQLAQAANPDGSYTQLGYDQAGNLTTVADFGAVPAGQTAPQLRSESFGYDPNGDQTSVKDWNGNTTSYAYNAAGQLTTKTQPVTATSSVSTEYTYDPAGHQTSVTSGKGNTTWTTYNPWNLPESVIEPATTAAPNTADRTWTTAYNMNGQRVSVSQPGGITQTYSYDPLGDLTSATGSGASASTADQVLGYNLDGQLTSATAPGGTDTFSYYDNGRLKNASGPSGTSSFTYNGDGLVSSATGPAGITSYTYDAAGRLATLADPLTGATLSYGYNADSQPVSIGYSTSSGQGPTRAFGYDSLDRLASDTLKSASGATLASQAYGYDNNSNLTSQTTTGLSGAGATTYTYDQANWLATAVSGGTTTSYSYDNDGNLTQNGATSNTYNAQDQLTSSTTAGATTSYGYTLSGALASITPSGGSAQAYTSDAFGNTITAPGGISYGYDALGRLVTRTVGAGSTSLSYLGTSASVASDGSSSYSYSPSGALVAAEASGGSGYATMSNQHGDLTATFSTGPGTASLAGSAAYSPYGTVTATTGTMPGLGYQGNYTDPATGQVNMGARWYNPATGSFTTNDTLGGNPISSTIDGNPYAYTDGNPLTQTDPTGHCSDPVWTPYGLMCGGSGVFWGGGQGGTSTGSQGLQPWSTQQLCQAMGISCQTSTPVQQPAICTACYDYNPLGDPFLNYPTTQPGCTSNCGGGGGSGGGGGCPGGCRPWTPPPPPPQDCYAGPDPACTPPPIPQSILDTPYVSNPVRYVMDLRQLIGKGIGYNEQAQPQKTKIKGTRPGKPSLNPDNDTSGDNLTGLVGPLGNLGWPILPVPPFPNSGPPSKAEKDLAKKAANVTVTVLQAAYGVFTGSIESIGTTALSCVTNPQFGSCAITALNIVGVIATGGDSAAFDEATLEAGDISVTESASALCGGLSFSADTKVLLAHGKKTPIASLRPGDKVLSANTKTGKNQVEKVAAVLVHNDTDKFDLKIRVGGRTAIIKTSVNHLFWNQHTHRWVKAAALKHGTRLRTPKGTATVLNGYAPKNRNGWMWDLTVTGNHDFYVAAGDSAILVHNCGPEEFPNLEPENMRFDEGDAVFFGVTPAAPGTGAFDRAIATAKDGVVKWAVTKGLGLRIMPAETADTIDLYHSVLSGGDPVLAAGEATIVKWEGRYYGREITYHSGHFQPGEESLDIGINAFRDAGIEFDETGSY